MGVAKWGMPLVAALFMVPALAQVKMEDALRREAPQQAQPKADAEPAKPAKVESSAQTELACKKQPEGCHARFKPVADSLVPQWFADQEEKPEQKAPTKARAEGYLRRYHDTLRKGGGEVNDVGRAYAFFVAVLSITHSGKGPDMNQFRTLVKRCQRELADDPQFQAKSDRDKQFAYERMIIIAMNNEAAVNFARQKGDKNLEARHLERSKQWLEDVTKRPIDKVADMWK